MTSIIGKSSGNASLEMGTACTGFGRLSPSRVSVFPSPSRVLSVFPSHSTGLYKWCAKNQGNMNSGHKGNVSLESTCIHDLTVLSVIKDFQTLREKSFLSYVRAVSIPPIAFMLQTRITRSLRHFSSFLQKTQNKC